MAVRKPRKIRGVHQLVPEPVKLPSFAEFVETQKNGNLTPVPNVPLAAQGSLTTLNASFVMRVDDAQAMISRDFYPIAWLYRDLFTDSHRIRSRAQQAERNRMIYAYRNKGPGMVVVYVLPYFSREHGLVLVLAGGVAKQQTDAGFVVKDRDTGRTIKVPWINVYGVEDGVGAYATIFFREMHYSHQRLSWLLGRYFVKYGQYPELYPDYEKAYEEFKRKKAIK